MRVAVLYRSHSEHERQVLEFEREFEHRAGRSLELLDVNTREGSSMASLYDVMKYPSVLAVSNEGVVQHVWDNSDSLPLINEVTYYTLSG
jgi:hypothetical protein